MKKGFLRVTDVLLNRLVSYNRPKQHLKMVQKVNLCQRFKVLGNVKDTCSSFIFLSSPLNLDHVPQCYDQYCYTFLTVHELKSWASITWEEILYHQFSIQQEGTGNSWRTFCQFYIKKQNKVEVGLGSCKVVFFCLAKEISLWKHNCCCVKVKVGPQTTEGRLFFFFSLSVMLFFSCL